MAAFLGRTMWRCNPYGSCGVGYSADRNQRTITMRTLFDTLEGRKLLSGTDINLAAAADPMTSEQIASLGAPATVTTSAGSFLVRIAGAGRVRITKNLSSNSIESIEILDTTARSTITINGPAGKLLDTRAFTAAAVVGTINAPSVRVVNGELNLAGVRKITLGELFGGSARIGSAQPGVTAAISRISDGGLTIETDVRDLFVSEWVDLDEAEQTLTAPSIRTLRSDDTFEASVTLTGALGKATFSALRKCVFSATSIGSISAASINAVTMTVGTGALVGQGPISSISVGGLIGNSTFTGGFVGRVNAGSLLSSVLQAVSISAVKVSGETRSSSLRVSSSLGSFSSRTMLISNVFAGVKTSVTALPTSTTDFSNISATIGSIRLTAPASGSAVAASNIAAGTIGSVNLGGIVTSNSNKAHGIYAGFVSNFQGRTPQAGLVKVRNLGVSGQSTSEGDFKITLF